MEDMITEINQGVFRLASGSKGPKEIFHNGEKLFRFMDCLYVRQEHLEDLSPLEVTNLCRARAQYPSLIGGVNGEVKGIFSRLIHALSPSKLLEIGAGSNPVLAECPPEMNYVTSDADADAGSGDQGSLIEFSDVHSHLPYQDEFFDMIVAVFVLHFRFYQAQVGELFRCMAKDGVFVANVYRRRQCSRMELQWGFESVGFSVVRISDPKQLCEMHEFWVVGKDLARVSHAVGKLEKLLTI